MMSTNPDANNSVTPDAAGAAAPAPAPVEPPMPSILAQLNLPFKYADYARKGYHYDLSIQGDQLLAVVGGLSKAGFAMDTITGMDWIAENQMEVVYDFYHMHHCCHVVIRVRVPRDAAEVPTISKIFQGADWHERETHDFFGIRFAGHPDLSPFLLPDDADYHPLRKDFSA